MAAVTTHVRAFATMMTAEDTHQRLLRGAQALHRPVRECSPPSDGQSRPAT
jgi:hypothetical protein